MLKKLNSADVMKNPSGIRIMGMYPGGCSFYGTTMGNPQRNDFGIVISVDVDGAAVCGNKTVSFGGESISLDRIRHFDQEIFSELFTLELERENQIKIAENSVMKAKLASDKINRILNMGPHYG